MNPLLKKFSNSLGDSPSHLLERMIVEEVGIDAVYSAIKQNNISAKKLNLTDEFMWNLCEVVEILRYEEYDSESQIHFLNEAWGFAKEVDCKSRDMLLKYLLKDLQENIEIFEQF